MAGSLSNITYDRPPLIEVAMSVQFEPPQGLTQAHLGGYWMSQRDAFPVVHSAQGIPASAEEFGGRRSWLPPALRLALTEEPDARVQMASADSQWMQQVQANRLVVNWRQPPSKTLEAAAYPRFSGTWGRFADAWKSWSEFLIRLAITPPKPTLWELVYVNRIARGTLWQSPADWPSVFPGLWGQGFAEVPGAILGGVHGQWVWETDEPPARLFIEPKPGRGPAPGHQEYLFVSLTARGKVGLLQNTPVPDDHGGGAIEGGIRHGHGLIVTAFDRIASPAAKKEWKRHDDSHDCDH